MAELALQQFVAGIDWIVTVDTENGQICPQQPQVLLSDGVS